MVHWYDVYHSALMYIQLHVTRKQMVYIIK